MLYNRKSKSRAAYFLGMALINPVKAFEYPVKLVCRNSDAGIFDTKLTTMLFLFDHDIYGSILFVIFNGIFNQIVYHFF